MSNNSFKDFIKERNQHIKRKDNEEVYSYLFVDRIKRIALYFVLIVTLIELNLYLFWSIFNQKHWLLIMPIAILIPSFLILVPLSEWWVYKPWQKSVQRCERMFLD